MLLAELNQESINEAEIYLYSDLLYNFEGTTIEDLVKHMVNNELKLYKKKRIAEYNKDEIETVYYNTDLTRDEIADTVGISRSRLKRLFIEWGIGSKRLTTREKLGKDRGKLEKGLKDGTITVGWIIENYNIPNASVSRVIKEWREEGIETKPTQLEQTQLEPIDYSRKQGILEENIEEVYKLRVLDNYTYQQLSKHFKISSETVTKFIKGTDFSNHKFKRPIVLDSYLDDLYKMYIIQGKSLIEIGDKYKYTDNGIMLYIHRKGLALSLDTREPVVLKKYEKEVERITKQSDNINKLKYEIKEQLNIEIRPDILKGYIKHNNLDLEITGVIDKNKGLEYTETNLKATIVQMKFDNIKITYQNIADRLGIPYKKVHYMVDLFDMKDWIILDTESKLELQIYNFLKTECNLTDKQIEKHNRKILKGKEIDLFLPDVKLGLEINDTLTHNSTKEYRGNVKAPEYHQNKVKNAEEVGIHLIHIYDYEWFDETKSEIIKSMLKTKLGIVDTKYNARDLAVKELEVGEVRDFLNANHLQGYLASTTYLGLSTKEGDLVSVMTFGKPRYSSEQGKVEIHRFVNKKGVKIIGGASRLLKNYLKLDKDNDIITYASLDFSLGKVYEAIGFEYKHTTKPGYTWVNLHTFETLSRYKVVGKEAELDIMKQDFVKVYNAGNKYYEYKNR